MFRNVFPVVSAIVWLIGAARAQDPNPEQLAWLKENAIVFNTAVAGSGFDDLAPLKALIGDARIVALGEATHGTREFFQMKHRLTEFLASEMGFTIFSIEANMPEAYRVNDFVLRGQGDPKKLLKGMYFWTWNTQEVLDMILWMREFNLAGKGRIEFTGFDMQTPDVAMRIVTDFLRRSDPEYAKTVETLYKGVKAVKRLRGADFGLARGRFPYEKVAGKKIRYAGYIRTEEVRDGFAGLWWRVDGKSGILAFDDMHDRGPKGTSEWKHYAIELDVVKDVTNINFGTLLTGSGTAWFDGLKVEIDGENFDAAELFDFDFESGEAKGFAMPSGAYEVKVSGDQAKYGKSSLRMSRVARPTPQVPTVKPAVARANAQEVLSHLDSSRDKYAKATSAKEFDWALQNARVVLQYTQLQAKQVSRDESMARNVKWILDHAPPGTKIVLWAHNGHVNRAAGWFAKQMGGYLDEMYGDDLVVIGFACNSGEYTAGKRGEGLRSDNPLKPGDPGSVEYYFHKSGLPRFILDLREASADSPGSAWLTETRNLRSIGARAMDRQFSYVQIRRAFDALIYFDRTHASRGL